MTRSEKALRMFFQPVSRFSIMLAGIYSFMWGLWVFSPFWDAFPTSPIYDILHFTGSEIIWGGVQMAVGLALIAASLDSIRFIKYATFAGFLSWTVIALSFAVSAPLNAGMWICGYLAATNAYFFLNVNNRDK